MSSFELNLNQDEWLDVTPREELLQHELNMLREELKQRSSELQEAESTIDLFRGHKETLENERSALKAELKSQEKKLLKDLMSVRMDLDASVSREVALEKELAQSTSLLQTRSKELEDTVSASEKEMAFAKRQIAELERLLSHNMMEQEKEKRKTVKKIQSHAGVVEDLKKKVSSLEKTSRNESVALAKTKYELKSSSAREEDLRRQLLQLKDVSEQSKTELQTARTDRGKIALLAEELREKNRSLERSLAKHDEDMSRSKIEIESMISRENSLKQEMEATQSKSDKVIKELEASLEREQKQLKELSKNQGNAVKNLKESLAREEALKGELSEVKASGERRLKELRQILGVEETLVASTSSRANSRFVSLHNLLVQARAIYQ